MKPGGATMVPGALGARAWGEGVIGDTDGGGTGRGVGTCSGKDWAWDAAGRLAVWDLSGVKSSTTTLRGSITTGGAGMALSSAHPSRP
ncbi:hypothetical protein GCM10010983_14050 [Caulobacter rhizosphaerae]|nr:hypothetical protein GCM10010983_14050 [Caulobacter rhizosphaerae]